MSKIDLKKCAPPSQPECWGNIDFPFAERQTSKLQRRIAKAWLHDARGKMSCLQECLIHSTSAKALAVRSVVSSKGRNTPGVDDVVWSTPEEKMQAVFGLKRRGYLSLPLRRIYIPKADGRMRALSIPTMKDRAMQTLYKLALEPVAEVTADQNSFGFRPKRSAKDAVLCCRDMLQGCLSAPWILEGDITACFDNISHEWLLGNIPMDKSILTSFLKCGYVENGIFYPTDKGVPQGGPISTVLCNMALDGLQGLLGSRFSSKVQFVRYADDFIVISEDRLLLEQAVPLLCDFLSERGLSLSREKTAITHLGNGFNFLGWNISLLNGSIRIRPSVRNKNSLLTKIDDVMRCAERTSMNTILWRLKGIICGWRNYHIGVIGLDDIYGIIADVKRCISRYTPDGYFADTVTKFFWSR